MGTLTGLSLELTCLHFHLFQLLLVENRLMSMFHLPLPAKPEDSPSQWLLTLMLNLSLTLLLLLRKMLTTPMPLIQLTTLMVLLLMPLLKLVFNLTKTPMRSSLDSNVLLMLTPLPWFMGSLVLMPLTSNLLMPRPLLPSFQPLKPVLLNQ